MDQNNPLAELTHKEGFQHLDQTDLAETGGYEVRDVHESLRKNMPNRDTGRSEYRTYNVTLQHARVDEYGFIETPYRLVNNGVVTREIAYLTADEEMKLLLLKQMNRLMKTGDL